MNQRECQAPYSGYNCSVFKTSEHRKRDKRDSKQKRNRCKPEYDRFNRFQSFSSRSDLLLLQRACRNFAVESSKGGVSIGKTGVLYSLSSDNYFVLSQSLHLSLVPVSRNNNICKYYDLVAFVENRVIGIAFAAGGRTRGVKREVGKVDSVVD